MTAPALAAHRFVCCCLLGAALGVYYEFLRPLRPRYTLAADALFLTGCVWVWLIMSFRVCRGDLRLGYSAGLLAGGIVWDLAFGSLIAPIFSGFWKFVRAILGFALLPAKKFSEFAKILFASAKKWVTIKWNHRREKRRKRRGENHPAALGLQTFDHGEGHILHFFLALKKMHVFQQKHI